MTSPNTRGARRWTSRIASGVVTFVMVVLVALAVLLVVMPRVMGGLSLTVLTGSMEPAIQPGDVVVTQGVTTDNANQLQVGDVISFLPFSNDPTLVTHRIIEKSVGADGPEFVTKGDNNSSADPWGRMTAQQIRGKLLFTVPKLGYLRQFAGNNLGSIVVGAAVILIGYGVVTVSLSLRKSRQPKRIYEPTPSEEEGPAPG